MPEPSADSGGGPFQCCEGCDSTNFKIWVKWGIWYAMCSDCSNEYGLYPKGGFHLLREPAHEPENGGPGRQPSTPPEAPE